MAEQSPAPTPSRGIYGFVIFLLFTTFFVLYVLWAFIPFSNEYELPSKYFALFLPILVLTATTVFAFFIYPSFSFIMTPDIDSINTITDSFAIRRCQYRDSKGVLCDNKITKELLLDAWPNKTECDNHQNRESKVSNYCDCQDKTKCWLATNPEYIEKIRGSGETQLQNSADLDLEQVSRVLYGKEE